MRSKNTGILILAFIGFVNIFFPNKVQAQWVENPFYTCGQLHMITWIDSETVYVGNSDKDKILRDYGIDGIAMDVPSLIAFPINDSVNIGMGNKVLFHFKTAPIFKPFDTLYTIRPQDSTPQYVQNRLIRINRHRWLHVYLTLNNDFITRYTEDQGKTWIDIPNILDLPLGKRNIYYYEDKFTLYSVDSSVWIYSGHVQDTLYRSDDFGKTWQSLPLPTWLKPTYTNSFAFANKDTGLMTCYNDGRLARTTDGGETWSSFGLQRPEYLNIYITYAPPTSTKDGLFFLYGPKGCHFSSSYGQWWKKSDNLPHNYLSFYDAEHGISFHTTNLTDNTYRFFKNNLLTDVEGIRKAGHFLYPNPTSDFITLDIETPTDLNIYTMQGRCVMSMTDVTKQSKIDISALENGSYFFVLPGLEKRFIVVKK